MYNNDKMNKSKVSVGPQMGSITTYSKAGLNHNQKQNEINHRTHPDQINHRTHPEQLQHRQFNNFGK